MTKKNMVNLFTILGLSFICGGLLLNAVHDATNKDDSASGANGTTSARIMASGDIFIHSGLYNSALQADGTYNFTPFLEYTREWISSADLAIGDYEGTISAEVGLSGSTLFNAPSQVANAMSDTGYDAVDLANTHILDSGLSGATSTVQAFEGLGLSTIGFYTDSRANQDILIKEVNGIKIAILGYSYGYRGMDASLTAEEQQAHLSTLDEATIQADIEEAEKKADITIVMAQMGTEYSLTQGDDQVTLYHKMIDWGADVILGGATHVAEPSETVTKDGQNKLIVYSMGNFLSTQTSDVTGNAWTERGVLMDFVVEKTGDTTTIKTVQAHPTLVWSWSKGTTDAEGVALSDYRTIVLDDFIDGGKYRGIIDSSMQEKVDTAYQEMNTLVNLQWN